MVTQIGMAVMKRLLNGRAVVTKKEAMLVGEDYPLLKGWIQRAAERPLTQGLLDYLDARDGKSPLAPFPRPQEPRPFERANPARIGREQDAESTKLRAVLEDLIRLESSETRRRVAEALLQDLDEEMAVRAGTEANDRRTRMQLGGR